MTLLPQNQGLPFINEPRVPQPYFLTPRPPAAETPGGFEKTFAEFLTGAGKREAEERAAGALRDREIRAREDVAGPARSGGDSESSALRKAAREAEDRREEEPGETGLAEEAARTAEALRTAPGEKETVRETGVRWETGMAAETIQEDPAGARFDGGPEGKFKNTGDTLPAEPFEPWFQAVYQGPAGGTGAEGFRSEEPGTGDAGGRGDGKNPGFAGPAHLTGANSLPDGARLKTAPGLPAKEGPAGEGGVTKKTAGTKNPAMEHPAAENGVPEKETPALRPKGPEGAPQLFAGLPGNAPGDAPGDASGNGKAARDYPAKLAHELQRLTLAGQDESGEARSRLPLSPLRVNGERGEEKPRETRGNVRRKVELRDYRERTPEEASPSPPIQSRTELRVESFSRDLISVDLISPRTGENRAGEKALQTGGNAGAFEEVLARELQQNLNSDIVRHAQVILRDKGEGLIRLSLKPESLGNVKIRLELTENKIAGRIIVESGEALRAFEREIASLEQAFRDSGYESAELNTFLAQDGQGSGGREEGQPFYSPRFAADKAASRYDEALERTDTSFPGFPGNGFGPGNGYIQVNILI